MSVKYLKNIALIGGSGQLGKHILTSLLSLNRFNITAVSRADSSATFPNSVKVVRGDYNDDAFLQRALTGMDALIITLAFMAPPTLQSRIIDAASKVGVPWILPNEFGSDNSHSGMRNIPVNVGKTAFREQIERSGTSSWIGLVNNPWFDYSLSNGHFGIDIGSRKATLYDGGLVKFNTTALPTVGKAVASLLSLPVTSSDAQPSLTDFKNTFAYVRSFHTSQREILDAVQVATDTSDAEWTIEQQDGAAFIQGGVERVKNGDFFGAVDILYGSHFVDGWGGSFEDKKKLNEVLQLPKEDLTETVTEVVRGAGRSESKRGDTGRV